MTRTVTLHEFMPYGAPDLQQAERPHLLGALGVATLLSLSFFLALVPLSQRWRDASPTAIAPQIPIIDIVDFQPHQAEPPVRSDAPPAPPKTSVAPPFPGTPVTPVADASEPTPLAPTPPGPSADVPGSPSRDGGPGGTSVDLRATEKEVLPERGAFVPFDEPPVEILRVQPEYPEMLRSAGFDGRVTMHVLVGREGRVLATEVIDRDANPMFVAAARAALEKWRFQPARTSGHPVAVWVAIKIRFSLH